MLYLLMLCGLIAACDNDNHGKIKGKNATVAVETVIVTRDALSISHSVAGTLEPARQIQIFNQEEGTITELPVYEGDRVAKSDKLVHLDDALVRAQYNKSVASRKQAELDLKRVEKLGRKKLASEDQLAQARTVLELAKSEEALQSTRISRTIIKAPFDGVVTKRLKEPGDVVPLHSHILTLMDPTSLRIKVPVSELILHSLKKDDPVKVRIDAVGDQIHTGHVSRVHPTVNPETRKGIIEVKLEPVPHGALPGQLCRVIVESQTAERRVVNLAAIRHDAKGEYVFLVTPDKKVKKVRVATGYQINESMEIVDGLSEGDEVVVKGFIDLAEGISVIPAKKESSQTKLRNLDSN